jgi:hypothetical protein
MKRVILISLSIFIALACYSQQQNSVDKKTERQLNKEQRQEQQRQWLEEQTKLVDSMMNSHRFVLEADFLSNEYGYRIMVNNNINFIAVDSSKITIQLGSTTASGGLNGFGGVTTDGNITQYEVKKVGKNGDNYVIKLIAMTTLGTYDIFINVSPDGNSDATISGLWHGRLNYHGRLVPIGVSRVFKAMSL